MLFSLLLLLDRLEIQLSFSLKPKKCLRQNFNIKKKILKVEESFYLLTILLRVFFYIGLRMLSDGPIPDQVS